MSDQPTRYRDLLAHVRRFSRSDFLLELSRASAGWNGDVQFPDGTLNPFAPHLVSGVAASAISRGYPNGLAPTREQVAAACKMFFALEHPGAPGDDLFTERLIARILYQQWPYRRVDLSHWARPVALFADTQPAASRSLGVIHGDWSTELLGGSVRDFVSVGFLLYSAATSGHGYPLPDDALSPTIHDLHGGRHRFESLVEQSFVSDIDTCKVERRTFTDALVGTSAEKLVREPFAFNPLVSHPLLRGIQDNVAIAPSVEDIALRTSCAGIVYEGLAKWEGGFTTDVGYLFEAYVGKQLELLGAARVTSEVSYRSGRDNLMSVDWIVVHHAAVLLVECKSALPRRDICEASDAFREAHEKIGRGIDQVNRTADAIVRGVPEFQDIPDDRPIFGLVVTLGNFDAANDPAIRAHLGKARVPTSIAGIDFLERLATLSAQGFGAFVDQALAAENNAYEPRGVLEGIEVSPNPILEAAFDSIPCIAAVPGS